MALTSKMDSHYPALPEDQFQTLENIPDGFYQSTPAGKILKANSALAEMLGYSSPAELLPLNMEQDLYWNQVERKQYLRSLEEKGKLKDYEVVLRRKDGKPLMALESAQVMRDENGRVLYYQGIIKDVSEWKRAEKMRDAAYRISETVYSAKDLNELFCSIHRIVNELVPADNFYIALHERDSQTLRFPYFVDRFDSPPPPRKLGKGLTEYVLRTGKTVSAPTPIWQELAQKGEIEPQGTPSVDWLGLPLKTNGKIIGVLAIQSYTEDVTFGEEEREMMAFVSTQVAMAIERKRNEEALRESERRYRRLMETANDAIVIFQVETGKVLECNLKSSELWGIQSGTLSGLHYLELFPEEEAARLAALFAEWTLKGKGFADELIIKRKDQRELWVDISASIHEVNGSKFLQGIFRDVTERRKAQEELKKHKNHLEELVKERTEDLLRTNQRLRQEIDERLKIEKELRRSNAELQQFAYVASHDLQEPLRMVSSYTQLLKRRYQGKLDASADEFISFAVDGAQRMQILINDLLTYSRVGTRGKEFEPVDVELVWQRVLTNLHTAIEESKASITHDPLPTLLGDPSQLSQLLQNLIANAIKFRGEKTPRIHFSAKKESGEWIFSVKDNGIGIAPEFYDRIFLIFQRLHSRSEYPGTGIGLAICKKIVERHGGRIWVESVPGQGSTFFFTIPEGG